MTKLYLVSQVDYEYNDEVYYASGDGVIPVRLYTDRTKAASEVVKKTLARIKRDELYSYGYCAEEIFNLDTLANILAINNVPKDVIYDSDSEDVENAFKDLLNKAIKEMNQPLVDQLIEKVLKIKFFKVQEVEVAE